MTFRAKIFLAFSLTAAITAGAVSAVVSVMAGGAFDRLDDDRARALTAQAIAEFRRRAQDVTRRVDRMAVLDSVQQMAVELSRPEPDASLFVNEAKALAASSGLDLVEIVAQDGAIVSSAHWPARFGYKDDWVRRIGEAGAADAQLKREELQEETVLALVAVRTVRVADRKIYVAGGEPLDREFLSGLVLPGGMHAALVPEGGEIPRSRDARVDVTPLTDSEGRTLASLVITASRAEAAALERRILWTGAWVGLGAVIAGLVLAAWATMRVTRPVRRLAAAAGAVAGGDWNTRVPAPDGDDEIARLARAFNDMTAHLVEQRERLVQAERVAAWRELARRLAHELKNPLFPLQITVENMRRARAEYPDQFEEVFREGVATVLGELQKLKAIVAQFTDFARMPKPERRPVDVNEVLRGVARLHQPQLDHEQIAVELELAPGLPQIHADPEQLHRALANLVLNAEDAMQPGGTLRLRTGPAASGGVTIEVADTGAGLTPEECGRLFTPYYTTKQHGTGLGLAIVQSVVSDHGGAITVTSEPGRGSTFHIEIPHGSPAAS